MYVPNNLDMFLAAYCGALSGMGASDRNPQNPSATAPVNVDVAGIAGAFAERFDTVWGLQVTNSYQIRQAESLCQDVWETRGPSTLAGPNLLLPLTFDKLVRAIIALITAGGNFLAGQGITPPAPSVSNVHFQEAGVPVLDSDTVNVTGAGGALTNVGGVATLNIPGPSVAFQEGGAAVVTSDTLNVTGAGGAVTNVGGVATLNIPGPSVAFQEGGAAVVTSGTMNVVGAGATMTSVGGVATLTVPGGSSGIGLAPLTKQIYRSPVSFMTSSGLAPTVTGSASAGGQFQTCRSGLTVIGLQTFWAGAATTIKASLWEDAATRVASGTLVVAGPGWYYIPFTVPYICQWGVTTATDLVLAYSIWDTNGVSSTRLAGAKSIAAYPLGLVPNALGEVYGGPDLQWNSWSLYGIGDSIPVTDPADGDAYPVEPVIVNWSAVTAAPFTMPAVGDDVAVTLVSNSDPYLHAGLALQVRGAGVMIVTDVSGSPTIRLLNIGDPYNAVPTTVIPTGTLIT
jgi:hypothetical protein